MLSDETWTYTWEHGRELASMSNGSTTWSMTYNADGLRTKRTNGSTTYSYIYNGSSLSRMTVGSNTLYFAYDASGTPMTVIYGGETYFYVTNIQGDVIAILDDTGATVVEYTYDAWGNVLTTTGSMASTLGAHNPLRYRGYVYDEETGLYYLQSRYYDPEMGRFINADAFASTGQGILGNNMFTYCNNNPINNIDPTGMLLGGYLGYRLGKWIAEQLEGWREDQRSDESVVYTRQTGAKSSRTVIIENSYKISSAIVMVEILDENQRSGIMGSTTAVLLEWGIHNIAYAVTEPLKNCCIEPVANLADEWNRKAAHVDLGTTIFADDHHPIITGSMCYLYWLMDPNQAKQDLFIQVIIWTIEGSQQ